MSRIWFSFLLSHIFQNWFYDTCICFGLVSLIVNRSSWNAVCEYCVCADQFKPLSLKLIGDTK